MKTAVAALALSITLAGCTSTASTDKSSFAANAPRTARETVQGVEAPGSRGVHARMAVFLGQCTHAVSGRPVDEAALRAFGAVRKGALAGVRYQRAIRRDASSRARIRTDANFSRKGCLIFERGVVPKGLPYVLAIDRILRDRGFVRSGKGFSVLSGLASFGGNYLRYKRGALSLRVSGTVNKLYDQATVSVVVER